MSAHLDEYYSDWLITQVGPEAENYKELCSILYRTEFIWFVPNDDNRVEDGIELRREFVTFEDVDLRPDDDHWMQLGCSVLELLVGLCGRMEFLSDRRRGDSFLTLISNLGLSDYDDSRDLDHVDLDRIDDILEDLIWRRYNSDGTGGLFPLENPNRDQREVEIWYQLNSYLIERD